MPAKKVVLITGSSTGFGRLTAQTLAKAGYVVYASLRNKNGRNRKITSELEDFAFKENLALTVVEIDVTKTRSVDQAVKQIIKEQGRIDVLVNNAGTLFSGITEAFTDDQVYDQLNTNFLGVVRCNRAVLPHMRKQGAGLLVHISSILGRIVFPYFGVYCASKYAVEGLAESLRYELSAFGVDSVIVEPGPFPTEIGNRVHKETDTARAQQYGDVSFLQGKIFGAVGEILNSGQAPNSRHDPGQVADVIEKLIAMPAGQRPLRTVVGEDFGTAKLNAAVDALQAEVMARLAVPELVQVRSRAEIS